MHCNGFVVVVVVFFFGIQGARCRIFRYSTVVLFSFFLFFFFTSFVSRRLAGREISFLLVYTRCSSAAAAATVIRSNCILCPALPCDIDVVVFLFSLPHFLFLDLFVFLFSFLILFFFFFLRRLLRTHRHRQTDSRAQAQSWFHPTRILCSALSCPALPCRVPP